VWLLGALGFLVAGWVGSSEAADPWSVQVIGTTGPGDTAIDSMTFEDAQAALESASTGGTQVVLPVAPSGFPGLTTTNAELDVDTTNNTLTVGGPVDLLGVNADMLVTAVWADADSDDAPSVTVAFRTGAASLSDFAPSLDAVDVGLSKTWTAFRRDSADTSAIPVGDLPQAGQDFFDDGDDASDDDFSVGQGVAFRALVDADSAGLGDALERVGVDYARLDGTLSTSDEALEDGAAAPTGFALTATLGVSSPASMPEWLELGSPWTLSMTTSGGDLTVGLEGGATVTLGDTPVTGTASVEVSMSGGALAVDLGIDIDTIEAPFGADWMTLDSASLTASISAGSVAGSLSAQVTIGEGADAKTGTVEVTLERTAGAVSATIDAELAGTISAFDLAELVGDEVTGLPAGVDVTLSDLALHVGVDGSTTPKALTVSATGTATVELGGSSIGATMLVRSSPDGLVVAARPSGSLSLSDLVGTVSPDPGLPDLSVVVSNQDFEAASGDLDAPTRQYFAAVLCPTATPDCEFDLDLKRGVALAAAIELPDALTEPLGEIGLAVDGPLKVTGLIPAFGGTTTSLTVELPGLSTAGDGGFVRGAGLAMEISKAGSTISFGLEGSLTLGIPRVESDNCPSNLHVDGTCIDEVKFSLTGRFQFTGTSTTFRIEGGLESGSSQGWQQPFGIPFLTLHEAKLVLGVTTGTTNSVDIGFLGRLVVGQTDISISALVGVTPNSPYLDFKGFTGSSQNGLSLRQLGKLYTDVSGQTIPESIIPPVGIRNLFLSIGHVDDPDLCLRAGFYISGDLYLDHGTPGGSITPGCLPPAGDSPSVTDQCEEDSDCLASMLIDVQTGKGGGIPSVNAQGYVAGWNAGPLSFDPTIVKFNLGRSGARVFLKGGATLLDPITYITDPGGAGVWASGSLTLDVGTQRLLVKGDLTIADGFLEAGFEGSGNLDLTNPDFAFSMYLRAAFLDDIAEGIDDAIRSVDAAMDEFAVAFTSQNVDKVFSEIRTAFTDLGNPGSATWQTLSTGYFDFRADIDSANDTLEDFGFGRPIPINAIMDLALHGVETPDIPSVEVCLFGGCATIWPAISIPDIPGMCSYVPVLQNTPICTAASGKVDDALRSEYAAPVIRSEVVDAGLTVPAGVSVDKLVTTFARIDPISTPASPSARKAATGGTEVTCAVAPVSYPSASVGQTTFDVQTMGTTVTVTGATPDELGTGGTATTAAKDEAEQDTFKALLTTSDPGGCTGSAPPPGPSKVLTMSLASSFVEEGSSLSATGASVGGAAGDVVTVSWGDGTTSTTTLSATKTWAANHVYVDDVGAGTTTTYTVRAEAPEHTEAIRQLGVVNVAPSITDIELTPESVDESALATLTGTIVDPGTLDTQRVVVDWGDGTAPQTLPTSGRTFTATHVYADDNPSATARDDLQVSIDVTDKDRAVTQEVDTQEVTNTPTYGVTFGAAGQLFDHGATFARTGGIVRWTGSASDLSVVDPLLADIDWGDGSATQVLLENTGTVDRALAAGHGYVEPCVYTTTVDVTDDDTGAADTVTRTVVVTRETADRAGGIRWWTRQFRLLDSGRPASLTAAQASCYLAVARQVSSTLGSKLRLRTAPQAYDVLSMTRSSGPVRPTPAQAALNAERDRLDSALLGALLDFTYGRRAWTAPVVRRHHSWLTFDRLVAQADQVRTSRSVERIKDVRKKLERL
jgi:hypothetical protein